MDKTNEQPDSGQISQLEENEKIKVTSYDSPKLKTEKKTANAPSDNETEYGIWKWLLPLILILLAAWFARINHNKKMEMKSAAKTKDSVAVKVFQR
jgi:ATP-dependent Zn protease